MKKTLISLGNLALEVGVNKSKLAYYARMGLLKPMNTIGVTQIYNKKKTLHRLDKILKAKKEGKTLREIKKILD